MNLREQPSYRFVPTLIFDTDDMSSSTIEIQADLPINIAELNEYLIWFREFATGFERYPIRVVPVDPETRAPLAESVSEIGFELLAALSDAEGVLRSIATEYGIDWPEPNWDDIPF